MSLLSIKNLSLHYGHRALLDHVELEVEPGERLCLLGRNGEGKSTLLQLIAGEREAEDGGIQRRPGLKVANLPQEAPPGTRGTVFEVVAAGLGALGATLAEYHHLLETSPEALERIGELQTRIDTQDGWNLDARVAATLSRLTLAPEADFRQLSGGLKRRVLLARALVSEPDLLLLDEPTNHLDVGSIAWLEEFLLDWSGTLLFITHDRAFLRRLATRIIELDRGALTSYPGDYASYQRRKAEVLAAETTARAQFDKKLAAEEVWIRQGIQARRTRNEGRVRALKQLREEYRARRERQGTARVVLQEAERSGKLVAEVEGLQHRFDDKLIVRDLTTTILRGDRVGFIGPNGSGKTTLLKLLLGELTPTAGSVRHGTKLQVAYFDQLRDTLDEDRAVFETIGEGQDFVTINGNRKHVLSYLQDFLFTPERARGPVRVLSGGERARLLLARLFSQPCNLLVMDEPTNDLDLETLDLLEERLLDFAGTLFLVSHDREFLNRVVTRSFAFEGEGRVGDYVGGYDDWLRQRPAPPPASASKKPAPAAPAKAATTPKRGLTQAERKELGALPGKLEKLEAEQARIAEALSEPDLFRSDPTRARDLQQQAATVERQLAESFARWETLEG